MSASLTVDPIEATLTYNYLNEPGAGAPASMEMHKGTAVLRFQTAELEEAYYTGRGRESHGVLRLSREARE